jgi:tetratricopeptide (TPR) repeat protein
MTCPAKRMSQHNPLLFTLIQLLSKLSASTPTRLALLALTGACWSAGAAPQEVPTRPVAQQEYWAQVDRRDWDAAQAAAEALIAKAREAVPQDPLALARAIVLRGNVQMAKADPTSAIATFSEALTLVEANAGTTSSQLVDPLRGLGFALARSGKHEEAVPPLERALLVTHRSLGLFDMGQRGLLQQLAVSLTNTGRAVDAERHMNYLLRLGERNYGERDPRMVPILVIVGDWYADTGNFLPARQLYRHALMIVGDKLGATDLAAVEPLRAYARSFTDELVLWERGLLQPRERGIVEIDSGQAVDLRGFSARTLNSDGERALTTALRILDMNSKRSDEMLAATLIQTGDWFQIKHQADKALPYYRRAWSVGSETPETKFPGRALLSFPVRVHYPTPTFATRNLRTPADQLEDRYVEVSLTVTAAGEAKDVVVVEENGSDRQAADTCEAMAESRFRPKFVDGEPVESPGITYREIFKVKKQAEEE